MDKYSLYEHMDMPDVNFPIRLFKNYFKDEGMIFQNHWHEQIEFIYIKKGEAMVRCNSCDMYIKPKDLLLVNSNELHYGENISGDLTYYVIIIDPSLLHSSSIDAIETKYITPITQNRILFKNKMSVDFNIAYSIDNIINEYETKETGYELAIKSYIYRLMVLLLRNHMQRILTENEYCSRIKNLDRFKIVFDYIENNYVYGITIQCLSKLLNISCFHFCRLFKEITGKTLVYYVNQIRIGKAEYLLKNSMMNISEIASNVGFNDINYFCRLFRKYKKVSPTVFRKT